MMIMMMTRLFSYEGKYILNIYISIAIIPPIKKENALDKNIAKMIHNSKGSQSMMRSTLSIYDLQSI